MALGVDAVVVVAAIHRNRVGRVAASVRFRHIWRRFTLFLCDHSRLESISVQRSYGGRHARLIVNYDGHRVAYLLVPEKPAERAEQLRKVIVEAAGLDVD